jgi:hypothetical protein
MHALTDPHAYIRTQVASASTKTWFRAFLILVGSYFTFRSISVILAYNNGMKVTSNVFRFTALETRSGTFASTPGIDAFGLMLHECPVDLTSSLQLVDGAVMYLIYDRNVSMNGWHITTPRTDAPDSDPVRFIVEASLSSSLHVYDDWMRNKPSANMAASKHSTVNGTVKQTLDGMPWEMVGSSLTLSHQSTTMLHLYEHPVNMTTTRGAQVKFDARILWPDLLFIISVNLIFAIGGWATLYLAVKNKLKYGASVVSGSFHVCAICLLVSGFAILASGDVKNSISVFMYAGCDLALGVGLVFRERQITQITFCAGICFILSTVIDSFVVYETPKVFARDIPYNGAILMLLSSFVFLRRKYTLRSAWRHIAHDIEAYNTKWRSILEDSAHTPALDQLTALAKTVECNGVLRQCNRAGKPGNDTLGNMTPRVVVNVVESGSRISVDADDVGSNPREGSYDDGDLWAEECDEGLPGVVRARVCVCECVCACACVCVCDDEGCLLDSGGV